MYEKSNYGSGNEAKADIHPIRHRKKSTVDLKSFRRDMLYGQVVVDFANARTPAEGLAVLRKHIKKLEKEKLIYSRLELEYIDRTFWVVREKLRRLLSCLVRDCKVQNIVPLRRHIDFYNLHCKPLLHVLDDGSIREIARFHGRRRRIIWQVFLTSCLINFLKHESEQKRRYIYYCSREVCYQFFLAKKADARIRVCPTCRNINRMPKEWRQQTDADRRYSIIERRIADQLQAKYEYLTIRYSAEEAAKEARDCIWEEVAGNKRLNRHKSKLEEFIKLRHRF